MRTKKESLKRLRSLSREQLNELSEEFTLKDKIITPNQWALIWVFSATFITIATFIIFK